MQQQQLPAPTPSETMAALNHFAAIEKELTILLSDPEVGKTNMRSRIIDGTARLVSTRQMEPGEAVVELGSLPDRPFDQKKWLEGHLASTVQAASTVLDHHRIAYAGKDVPPPSPQAMSPEGQRDALKSLMMKYKGAPNG